MYPSQHPRPDLNLAEDARRVPPATCVAGADTVGAPQKGAGRSGTRWSHPVQRTGLSLLLIGLLLAPITSAEAMRLVGDVNSSGAVDVQDVQSTINIALGAPFDHEADINGDELVNVQDVQEAIGLSLGLGTHRVTHISGQPLIPGSTAVLIGRGFSPVAAENLIDFNGTTVTANAVSLMNGVPASITCTVPMGARTGRCVVTAAGTVFPAFHSHLAVTLVVRVGAVPIEGATVVFKILDPFGPGSILGTAPTDADGLTYGAFPNYEGPMIVEVTGGQRASYGATPAAPGPAGVWRAIAPFRRAGTSPLLSVTPLSELTTALGFRITRSPAQVTGPGGPVAAGYEDATDRLAIRLGLDPAGPVLDPRQPGATASQTDRDRTRLALAFDGLPAILGAANLEAIVTSWMDDLVDGVLDGVRTANGRHVLVPGVDLFSALARAGSVPPATLGIDPAFVLSESTFESLRRADPALFPDDDLEPPGVLATAPSDGDDSVPLDIRPVLQLSRDVNPATLTTARVRLLDSGTPVPIQLSFEPDSSTLTVTPATNLLPLRRYRLVVSDLEDKAGQVARRSTSMVFTTGAAPAPSLSLLAVEPGPGQTLDPAGVISLIFNQPLLPSSLRTAGALELEITPAGGTTRLLPFAIGDHPGAARVQIVPAFDPEPGATLTLDIAAAIRSQSGAALSAGAGTRTLTVRPATAPDASAPVPTLLTPGSALSPDGRTVYALSERPDGRSLPAPLLRLNGERDAAGGLRLDNRRGLLTIVTAGDIFDGADFTVGLAGDISDAAGNTTSAQARTGFIRPGSLALHWRHLPALVAGQPCEQWLACDGGTAPYAFSASSLPTGLSLDPDGRLHGTPAAPVTTTAEITLTDAAGQISVEPLDMTVLAPAAGPTLRFVETRRAVNEDAGTILVEVELTVPPPTDTFFSLVSLGGSAEDFVDHSLFFASSVAPATSAPGTRFSLPVDITDDPVHESVESFAVVLVTSPPIPSSSRPMLVIDILDNDPRPVVDFALTDTTVDESDGAITLLLRTSNASSRRSQVRVNLSGSAMTPGDATVLAAPVLEIPAMRPQLQSVRIPIQITDDALREPDETLVLTLSTPVGASLGSQSTHTITIRDNEPPPDLVLSSSTVDEASGLADLELVLSGPLVAPATFRLDVQSAGIADASDFVPLSTIVSLPAGAATATVAIAILDDQRHEPDERLTVTPSAPSGIQLGAGATITIRDDDPLVASPPTSLDISEGNPATVHQPPFAMTPADLTVTLDRASQSPIALDLRLEAGSATASDFAPLTTTRLDFAPGAISATLPLAIIADNLTEPDEDFRVVVDAIRRDDGAGLAGFATLSLARSATVVRVLDDDPVPVLTLSPTDILAGESSGPLTFEVLADHPSSQAIAFDLTASGDLLLGTDFVLSPAGRVTIPAASSGGPGPRRTLTITLVDDTLTEPKETAVLSLANAAAATIGTSSTLRLEVTDDDALPTLVLADLTVGEAVGAARLPVNLSEPTSTALTLNVSVSPLDVATPGDLGVTPTTLDIPAGASSAEFVIPVQDDALHEPTEHFQIQLSSPNANILVNILDGDARLSITDNDPLTASAPTNLELIEGNPATSASQPFAQSPASLVITLDRASQQPVQVTLAAAPGTAAANDDYLTPGGVVVFLPGQTSASPVISVVADNLREDDELFHVDLLNLQRSDGGAFASGPDLTVGGRTTITIRDDDPLPEVAFVESARSATEGDGSITVGVHLSHPTTQPVVVDLSSVGSAGLGEDLVLTPAASLTIPGETRGGPGAVLDLTALILDDSVNEPTETRTVTLAPSSGATLGAGASLTLTIADDDPLPEIRLLDLTVAESVGTAGLPVTVSGAGSRPITLAVAVAAVAPASTADVGAAPAVLTIPPGVTATELPLSVVSDGLNEPDETLSVVLSAPQFATLADGEATLVIEDDDPVLLTLAAVTVVEGNAAASAAQPFARTAAALALSLSRPSQGVLRVGLATTNGAATANDDFDPLPAAITVPAGASSTSAALAIVADNLREGDETFLVRLEAPQRDDGTGFQSSSDVSVGGETTITIEDDDPVPTLAFATPTLTASEDSGIVSLTLILSHPTTATAGATLLASGDLDSADLVVGPPAVISIPAASAGGPASSSTLILELRDDLLVEGTESLTLQLSAPVGATIGAPAAVTLTVEDDDLPPPSLAILDGTAAEDSGIAMLPITITGVVSSDASVSISVTPVAPASPADLGATPTSLVIAAGATTASVAIPIVDDAVNEADETVLVSLFSPSGATLGDAVATLTISDDDPLPSVTLGDRSVSEGVGAASLPWTLTGLGSRAIDLTVSVQPVAPATAADLDSAPTSLVIPPGATSGVLTLPVLDDDLNEPAESIEVQLSSPNFATLADDKGVLTIQDDDPLTLTLSAPAPAGEGNPALSAAKPFARVAVPLIVQLDRASQSPVRVALAITDGSARAGLDVLPPSGPATVAPAMTSTTLTIELVSDNLHEGDESLGLSLSPPQRDDGAGFTTIAGVSAASGTQTLVILDDDPQPSLSFDQTARTVSESAGIVTLTLRPSGPTTDPISVLLSSTGTLEPATDLSQPPPTTLTLPGVDEGGEAAALTLTLAVLDDAVQESTESLDITIGAALGASIGSRDTFTLTVLDNEQVPELSIADRTVDEDVGLATLTIAMTGSTASDLSVAVALETIAPASTADHGTAPTGLVIPAGQTTATIEIPVVDDGLHEPSEQLRVQLTLSPGVIPSDPVALLTILDDDALELSAATTLDISEGNPASSASLPFARSPATLTLTLGRLSQSPVRVQVATTPGSASGADFDALAMTPVIAAGESSLSQTVSIVADNLREGDETFEVRWSAPERDDGAGFATSAALTVKSGEDRTLVTILDDDPTPLVSVSQSALSRSEDSAPIALEVRLSHPTSSPVTLTPATSGTLQAADLDASLPATLSVPAASVGGAAPTTGLTITLLDDDLNEATETLAIDLTAIVNANAGTPDRFVLTVTDNDALPALTLADLTVSEGVGSATVPISISGRFSRPIEALVTVTPISPASASDLGQAPGSLLIAPGSTTATVAVPVNDDALSEVAEAFEVTLSSPNFATLARATATLSLTDDDPVPVITIADLTVSEGVGAAALPLSIQGSFEGPLELTVAVQPLGVTSLADLGAVPAQLTIASGATNATLTIGVVDDSLHEPGEAFRFTLGSSGRAMLGDGEALLNVLDDDALALSGPASLSITEGNPAQSSTTPFARTPLTVTISADRAAQSPIRFTLSSQDVEATAGLDHELTTTTVTLPAGATSASLSVPVIADNLFEGSETFAVVLSTPERDDGAGFESAPDLIIGRTSTPITILDDDPLPTIAFTGDTFSVNEGDGAIALALTVSHPSAEPITVTVSSAGTLDGADLSAPPASGLSVAASASGGVPAPQTLALTLVDDGLWEGPETLDVTLSAPVGATLGARAATRLIVEDNDARPTLAIADLALDEDVGVASMTVSLSGATARPATMRVVVTPLAPATATDLGVHASKLTLPVGVSTAPLTIPVVDDTLHEPTESFRIELTELGDADAGDVEARLTIRDNDPLQVLAPSSLTIVEGNPATSAAQPFGRSTRSLGLVLSRTSQSPIRVDVATAPDTATTGLDFDPIATMLTFPAGATQASVDVAAVSDNLKESNESFQIELGSVERDDGTGWTSAPDLNLSAVALTAHIVDDDPIPTVEFMNASRVLDEDAGLVDLPIHLSHPTTAPVSIAVNSSGDLAPGSDYLITGPSPITFAASSVGGDPSTAVLSLSIIDDAIFESQETGTFSLVAPVNATTGATTSLSITVRDNEPTPALAIQGTSGVEGQIGPVALEVTLTPSSLPASVGFSLTELGTATAADIGALPGPIDFAPGETTKTVTIAIVDDDSHEPDETLMVRLVSPTGAVIQSAAAALNIADDDPVTILTPNNVEIIETRVGTGRPPWTSTATQVLFTLDRHSETAIRVDVSSVAETAAAVDDFTPLNGTLIFPAGQPQAGLGLAVIADTILEPDETWRLDFSNPLHQGGSGYVPGDVLLGAMSLPITILDDDSIEITVEPTLDVTEGSGSKTAHLRIEFSNASAIPINIPLQAIAGTATTPEDFVLAPTTLTLPSDELSTSLSAVFELRGDSVEEALETFRIELGNPSPLNPRVSITQGVTEVRIADDDQATRVDKVFGNGARTDVVDGAQGTATGLRTPLRPALDADGNLYVIAYYEARIYRLSPDGTVTHIAGSGAGGSTGDGGLAKDASLASPFGLAIDGRGLFVSEVDTQVGALRRIDLDTNIITRVADLPGLEDLYRSAPGVLHAADRRQSRILRIDLHNGNPTVVAGTGLYGAGPENVPAPSSPIATPRAVFVDPNGDVYFAEYHRIRRVDAGTGLISTVAGQLSSGFSGDGGPAIDAELTDPTDIERLPSGELLIIANGRFRTIDSQGIIRTIGGDGASSEDGIRLGDLSLSPFTMARGPDGLLYATVGDSYVAAIAGLTGPALTQRTFPAAGLDSPVHETIKLFGPSTAPRVWRTPGQGLPAGLSLTFDGPCATISGTLLEPGPHTFAIEVEDAGGVIRRRNYVIPKGGLIGDVLEPAASFRLGLATDPSSAIYAVRKDPATDRSVVVIRRPGARRWTPVARLTIRSANILGFRDATGELIVADSGLYALNPRTGLTRLLTPGLATDFGDVGVDGTIAFAVTNSRKVYTIAPDDTVTHIAGNGTAGTTGDGGPALAATFLGPIAPGVTADAILVPDGQAGSLRRIDRNTGVITTVSGGPGATKSPFEEGPASETQFLINTIVKGVDRSDRPYFYSSQSLYRFEADGTVDFLSFGQETEPRRAPIEDVRFGEFWKMARHPDGSMLDAQGDRPIVRITGFERPTTLTITGAPPAFAVAGLPYEGPLYALGPNATKAWSLTAGTLPDGLQLVSGPTEAAIRGTPTTPGTATVTLSVTDGTTTLTTDVTIEVQSHGKIVTVGDTTSHALLAFDTGDWLVHEPDLDITYRMPAGRDSLELFAASLPADWGFALDSHGARVLAAYSADDRLRTMDIGTGAVSVIAGNGTEGFAGDGGPATAAALNNPRGTAAASDGTIYIADSGNHRIRAIDPLGVITTVAGNGTPGFAGDGGLATAARLDTPSAVAVLGHRLIIADSNNHRLREVDLNTGLISTIAGTGASGTTGDGGPATAATLRDVTALVIDRTGGIILADSASETRVRRIDPAGTIRLLAGGGSATDFRVDAGDARLDGVRGLSLDALGRVMIPSFGTGQLRLLDH